MLAFKRTENVLMLKLAFTQLATTYRPADPRILTKKIKIIPKSTLWGGGGGDFRAEGGRGKGEAGQAGRWEGLLAVSEGCLGGGFTGFMGF